VPVSIAVFYANMLAYRYDFGDIVTLVNQKLQGILQLFLSLLSVIRNALEEHVHFCSCPESSE
jgi:hypothetical protein